ncbi:SPOR domain-containing protein [Pseudodonghicola xiamenensis]|uniref:Sporulation protein n=1 Tax=Pseudodonghicola xiamenensis TaxID=337702 RepID=A0A8J3H314_9RHOB|nr:SPOR domain-containing protein [Pseudodonghicola xiamenensis]GHG80057.1 sporulation protein [Pseudodonghicola xiamenensis]
MADNEYTYGVYGEELYAEDYAPQEGANLAPAREGRGFSRVVNIAGAVASLALVVGVGVWGYKLMVRDVSGVPVVRALAGPMRVSPEDPGGQPADHMGLAVNEIAAGQGASEELPERLTLAPRPVHLSDEDTPMTGEEETVVAASADAQAVEKFRDGSIDALVRQLTDGVDPLDGGEDADETMAMGEETADDRIGAELAGLDPELLNAPGIKVSPRPMERPLRLASARADVAEALETAQNVMASSGAAEIEASSLSAGTRLAQLGAYDSPEIAREEWEKLFGRFGDYMDGKKRVIQKASSGGRTFYRLRAMGFDDLSDARRFCSALVAENADCIPVTVR